MAGGGGIAEGAGRSTEAVGGGAGESVDATTSVGTGLFSMGVEMCSRGRDSAMVTASAGVTGERSLSGDA